MADTEGEEASGERLAGFAVPVTIGLVGATLGPVLVLAVLEQGSPRSIAGEGVWRLAVPVGIGFELLIVLAARWLLGSSRAWAAVVTVGIFFAVFSGRAIIEGLDILLDSSTREACEVRVEAVNRPKKGPASVMVRREGSDERWSLELAFVGADPHVGDRAELWVHKGALGLSWSSRATRNRDTPIFRRVSAHFLRSIDQRTETLSSRRRWSGVLHRASPREDETRLLRSPSHCRFPRIRAFRLGAGRRGW